MRTFINTISQLLAVTAAAVALIWSLPAAESNRSVLLVLALVSAVSVVVLWSSVLLLHSVHVRLTKLAAEAPGFSHGVSG